MEVPRPVRSVGSDDKSIFNLVELNLLEVSMIKLVGEPIAMLSFVCRSMRLSVHARRASGHPQNVSFTDSWSLVKSDTTSKLTIISCGPARGEPSVHTKSAEFFIWCGELPI
jgi:hypothetical protein